MLIVRGWGVSTAHNPHYVAPASRHWRTVGLRPLLVYLPPNPSANGLRSARSRKRLARSRARAHAAPRGLPLVRWSCKTLALQKRKGSYVPHASRVGAIAVH